MSLGYGRKTEYLEENHVATGSMCKLLTELNSMSGLNLDLCCCQAGALPAVPPCLLLCNIIFSEWQITLFSCTESDISSEVKPEAIVPAGFNEAQ